MADIHVQIKNEMSKAFEELGASSELLAIVGSYHDTQSDEDILQMLHLYNTEGSCMTEIIAVVEPLSKLKLV